MPELVRYHVRLGEVSRCTEALGELVEEAEVEVDMLIDRAIERADLRRGLAAPSGNGASENGELRVAILLAVDLREQLRPRLLDIVDHEVDDLESLLLLRRLARWLLHVARGGLRHGTPATTVEDVHAEDEAQNQGDHRAADSHPAPQHLSLIHISEP